MNILNIDSVIEILLKCLYIDVISFSKTSIKYFNMVNNNKAHILNTMYKQKLNKNHGYCVMSRWFYHNYHVLMVQKEHSIIYGQNTLNLTERIVIYDDHNDGYNKTVYKEKQTKYKKDTIVHDINYIMEFYYNYFNELDINLPLITNQNYNYKMLSEQEMRKCKNECLFISDLFKLVWNKT